MNLGKVIAMSLWSLGGILIGFIGLTILELFLGLDPVYDLWKTSLGLTAVELVGGGVVLILAGSWVNHKTAETLQSK